MTVVSDTSPICYLALIGHLDLLSRLFGYVAIPTAVKAELGHPSAPIPVQEVAAALPTWIEVQDIGDTDPDLAALHAGEREAILLAEHLHADLILIDERAAREAARSRGLTVTGLLGVLATAVDRGLVDPVEAVARLRETTFRASPRLLRDLEQRRPPSNPPPAADGE